MRAISAIAWPIVFAVVIGAARSAPGLGVSPARAASAAGHPLEPLSAAELKTAYEVIRAHFAAAGLPTEPLRFPSIALDEPPKAFVRAWTPGQGFPRRARAQVTHYFSNRLWVAVVDLAAERVTSLELQPGGIQGPVTAEEYVVADALVHAYAPWQAAMPRRGLDPNLVYVDVWAPGDLGGVSRRTVAARGRACSGPSRSTAARPSRPSTRRCRRTPTRGPSKAWSSLST
jgi:Cu2+-containing amine oxidase